MRLARAQARRSQDSGSTSQTAPWPLPWVSNRLASVGGEIDHRPAVPGGELRADLGSGRNVPERRDGLPAGDGEGPAIRAELEGKRLGAALVELVDELPGADVPEAYDSAPATDGEHSAVGAEGDG